MPAEILIGIDLGTTVLKAGAIDRRSGRVLALAAQRLPVHAEADGTREQQLPELDRGFDTVLGRLRAQLGKRWAQVTGVGLASQGGSFAICNRQTGAALTPLRLWSDQRAGRFVARVAALRPVSYWQELALNTGPGWGLARMLWLREQNPRLFAHSRFQLGE